MNMKGAGWPQKKRPEVGEVLGKYRGRPKGGGTTTWISNRISKFQGRGGQSGTEERIRLRELPGRGHRGRGSTGEERQAGPNPLQGCAAGCTRIISKEIFSLRPFHKRNGPEMKGALK